MNNSFPYWCCVFVSTDGVPRPMNVTPVAFTAVKTSTQNMSEGDILQFDLLLTNLGDGFNLLTGFFTCPVAGFYSFYFSLDNDGANEGQVASVTLVMDGANQVSLNTT